MTWSKSKIYQKDPWNDEDKEKTPQRYSGECMMNIYPKKY
jgi:hypothetical protein